MASKKPQLNYAPLSDAHMAYHNSQETVTIAIGGVDSGKTYMALADVLDHLLFDPEGKGKTALIVARTHTHAKRQLLPIIEKILSGKRSNTGRLLGLRKGEHYRVNLSSPITITLPYGSTIIIWSIEGGEAIKGLNVTYAYVDELTDMEEQHYNDTFDRIGREGVRGRLWATGNPKHKGHWVYKRFFEEYDRVGNIPGSGVWCCYLTTFDNPLAAAKLADYERTYGYSALERQRKLEGRFVNMEGLCLPNWDADKHLFDRHSLPIGSEWHHYIGLDFGEKDPTAALRIARTDDGRFYVYAEYYERGKTISEHCKYILRPNFPAERILRVFSDTHLETVSTYRENGVTNIEPVKKGAGSVVAGIALLNQLLQDGKLFISRDCTNLIREIETYEWKSSSSREETKPGYGDHAIDALRYCVTSLMQRTQLSVRTSLTPPAPKAEKADTRTIFAYERDGTPIYVA